MDQTPLLFLLVQKRKATVSQEPWPMIRRRLNRCALIHKSLNDLIHFVPGTPNASQFLLWLGQCRQLICNLKINDSLK